MLSRFILVPFVLVALACLYFVWEGDMEPLYLVPFVIAVAIVLVSSPNIDWWWANRNPQPMDPKLEGFLHRFFPYYNQLSIPAKKRFSNRVRLYLMATNFMPKAMDDVPEDVKGLIAANAVMLTLGQKEYRFKAFETIVVYPHPFPSPQFEMFHACEIYEDDGVMLFSLEQLIPGATQKTKYYNTALHEYAHLFVKTYPEHPYPAINEAEQYKLEQISGFKMKAVQNYIGLPAVNPLLVSINYFFIFPQKFQQFLPEIYETYKSIFNQDPVKGEFPVVDEGRLGKI